MKYQQHKNIKVLGDGLKYVLKHESRALEALDVGKNDFIQTISEFSNEK